MVDLLDSNSSHSVGVCKNTVNSSNKDDNDRFVKKRNSSLHGNNSRHSDSGRHGDITNSRHGDRRSVSRSISQRSSSSRSLLMNTKTTSISSEQSIIIRILHVTIGISIIILLWVLILSNLQVLCSIHKESTKSHFSPSNDDFAVTQPHYTLSSNDELFMAQPQQQTYNNATVLNQTAHQAVVDQTKQPHKDNATISNQTEHEVDDDIDPNDDEEFSYSYNIHRKCHKEYRTIKKDQTRNGLQYDDYKRSQAYYGNRQRLYRFVQGLQNGVKPKKVIVCGGSISIGHGVKPRIDRYADRFIRFLNERYPVKQDTKKKTRKRRQKPKKHELHMKVAHGADMCAMAKRIHKMELPDDPDLFLLEFAVNDYQGQDHIVHVDHKTDVFYDGFERLAICAEAVVHTLLTKYPKAAIVFLEFRTAILNRKTAQLLHNGVAQHYQIPVISYADAIFPKYYNLISQLNRSSHYSVPVGESIQPFPFGCLKECPAHKITEQFRPAGCQSVCTFLQDTGYKGLRCHPKGLRRGRMPCYVSFLSHDSVHPSSMGHQLANDLLIELIAGTARELCRFQLHQSTIEASNSNTTTTTTPSLSQLSIVDTNFLIPKEFGFLASPAAVSKYSDFVLVQDTMLVFDKQDALNATSHSDGFTLYGDGFAERTGWISTSLQGGEYIEFTINLPIGCYVVYLAGLKSYANMGMYTVELTDQNTNNVTRIEVDGQWSPRISIPSDIPINGDIIDGSCTGHCTVKVLTHPQVPGRTGNKVKIMSLSARKCIIESPTVAKSATNNGYTDPRLLLDLQKPSSWITV